MVKHFFLPRINHNGYFSWYTEVLMVDARAKKIRKGSVVGSSLLTD